MNCLVIGYGSIGRRHAEVLSAIGHNVVVVDPIPTNDYVCHISLDDAYKSEDFDYAVIANVTSEHYNTLEKLNNLSHNGPILVEKPIFAEYRCYEGDTSNIFVGYNLRFHPIIEDLKKYLGDGCYSMNVYTGQYLPDWRPEQDYRESYSASISKGGGVIMDLSHEIDYISWLIGKWLKLSVLKGKFSNLEIETEDVCSMLMETEKCPSVVLQLDYLNRQKCRRITVNAEDKTIEADLIAHTMRINDELKEYAVYRNDTYEAMHKALLNGNYEQLCSYNEGIEILKTIEMMKSAADSSAWVTNN